MKVLHIITRMNQGGTSRWLESLSNQLVSAGWDSVVIAGVVGKNEVEDDCFQALHGTRVRTLGKGKGPISDLRSLLELRKLIITHLPDVINTHTSKAGVLGRIAAFTIPNSEARVIHTYHGHLLYGYFSKPVSLLINTVEKLMSLVTDHFIVAGKTVRDQLIGAGIGNEKKYSIIYPGVDVEVSSESRIARSQFGIDNEAFVVGWMGRFEKIKSPIRVVELARHFPHIVFLMAGSGSMFEEIKLSAPSNLLLPGWSDANQIWSASDVALLTSENEALPIALIESGLFGIPSIAENVGSVSEVVLNNISGFLCNNLEQRVKALNTLHSNSDLCSKMGGNAMKHCSRSFSIEKFGKDHNRVYLGRFHDENQ